MDVGSRCGYPGNQLSNFAAHRFVLDDILCCSMEGFLQALKFPSQVDQERVCRLVGFDAKKAGRNQEWWKTQTLWWKGVAYGRLSEEYQQLLDRAYDALFSQNLEFRRAISDTMGQEITHSIGKSDPSKTILTEMEFCSRLVRLRSRLS